MTLAEILQVAIEIFQSPCDGKDAGGYPALVCASIAEIDPKRVCLTIYNGHPVTVWPKGLRPLKCPNASD